MELNTSSVWLETPPKLLDIGSEYVWVFWTSFVLPFLFSTCSFHWIIILGQSSLHRPLSLHFQRNFEVSCRVFLMHEHLSLLLSCLSKQDFDAANWAIPVPTNQDLPGMSPHISNQYFIHSIPCTSCSLLQLCFGVWVFLVFFVCGVMASANLPSCSWHVIHICSQALDWVFKVQCRSLLEHAAL